MSWVWALELEELEGVGSWGQGYGMRVWGLLDCIDGFTGACNYYQGEQAD